MTDHLGQRARRGRYRYEATVKLVIYADGQDIAWRNAKDAARNAGLIVGVEDARASLMDLRYAPPEPPVGADGQLIGRGQSES